MSELTVMSHSEIRLGRPGRPTAAIKRPHIETWSGTGRRTCCWGAPTTPPAWTCGAPAASSWRCCWATPPSPGCGTPGTSSTRSSAWWAPPPRTAGPASPGSPTTARTSSSATPPRPEDRSALDKAQPYKHSYILHPCCSWRTSGRGCTTSPSPSTWRARCCSRARRGACPRRLRCGTGTSATCRPACTASTPGPACTACRASPSTTTTTGRQPSTLALALLCLLLHPYDDNMFLDCT